MLLCLLFAHVPLPHLCEKCKCIHCTFCKLVYVNIFWCYSVLWWWWRQWRRLRSECLCFRRIQWVCVFTFLAALRDRECIVCRTVWMFCVCVAWRVSILAHALLEKTAFEHRERSDMYVFVFECCTLFDWSPSTGCIIHSTHLVETNRTYVVYKKYKCLRDTTFGTQNSIRNTTQKTPTLITTYLCLIAPIILQWCWAKAWNLLMLPTGGLSSKRTERQNNGLREQVLWNNCSEKQHHQHQQGQHQQQ